MYNSLNLILFNLIFNGFDGLIDQIGLKNLEFVHSRLDFGIVLPIPKSDLIYKK